MISKENLQDLYPLTPMQENMLFHVLYARDSLAYVEQMVYRVRGALDERLFEQAWNRLLIRHDVLRSVFVAHKAKQPLQMILREQRVEFHVENLAAQSPEAREARIAAFREQDRARGFNLERDPLIRVSVLRTAPNQAVVIWCWHHILMDGWCIPLIQADLMEIYQALVQGREPKLDQPPSYKRYLEWLAARDRSAAMDYWRDLLAGFKEPTGLPRLRTPDPEAPYELRKHVFLLDEATTRTLNERAAAWLSPVNAVLQAVWGVLLGSYNGVKDAVFGAVVSGRPADLPGVEKMIGLLINTLPVRVRTQPDDTFRTVTQRLRDATAAAAEHQHVPLSEVQNQSPLKQRLLDHVVAFENYPVEQVLKSAEGPLTVADVDSHEQTGYDFALVMAPGPRLRVEFQYNAQVYDEAGIVRLQRHFQQLLTQALRADEPAVVGCNMLPEDERVQVEGFSRSAHAEPPDMTLTQLFADSAARHAMRPAVKDGNMILSYAALAERTDNLAASLLARGVKRGQPTPVLLERSWMLPVALIGALKAGAAYLPLDTAYPAERLRFMIEDVEAEVVVTTRKLARHLPAELQDRLFFIEDVESAPTAAALPELDPGDLAYLIYTSGSTGRPKGVMIAHLSAANLVQWHTRFYALDETARATMFASPAFDASLLEMLPALLNGACLYPLPEDLRADPTGLARFYSEKEITHTFVSPLICEALCRDQTLPERLKLLTGGDVLRTYTPGKARVYNNYGPTECTVVSTAMELTAEQADGPIPIGRPIDNVRIMILSPYDNMLPIGVPGEICIAGANLGRGYWRRPDLTEQAFPSHPTAPGNRIYRTGDRGRWLADGTIAFMGRLDRQVKIRGYRIELGEIEAVLREQDDVTDAVVRVLDRQGEKQLAAYVVTNHEPDFERMRQDLFRRLPDYMVPQRIMRLDKIPLTSSGKLDRDVLPEPDAINLRQVKGYAAPRNELEHGLVEIWATILAREQVGINDSFFELGGHSLTATAVMSQVRARFKVELPVRRLFEAPTVARFAEIVQQALQQNPATAAPAAPGITRQARQSRTK